MRATCMCEKPDILPDIRFIDKGKQQFEHPLWSLVKQTNLLPLFYPTKVRTIALLFGSLVITEKKL